MNTFLTVLLVIMAYLAIGYVVAMVMYHREMAAITKQYIEDLKHYGAKDAEYNMRWSLDSLDDVFANWLYAWPFGLAATAFEYTAKVVRTRRNKRKAAAIEQVKQKAQLK